MSVQFGIWNFNRAGVAPEGLARTRAMLSTHMSEGEYQYSGTGIHLIYLPFHVTPESECESQPFVTPMGKVLIWDGRLDNRQELIGSLRKELREDISDVAIAAAAIESWGTPGLGKLVGDWALSLWDPTEQSVLLAKDFLGARQLYYTVQRDLFAWCTLIDPLLLNQPFQLQEEFLAGWISQFPAAHLTPFAGIHAVPPGSLVSFCQGKTTVRRYWDFDPGKRIRYRDDREYEEHFRNAFGESVRRRLLSTTPVLAELSGGMDSSSIVCMADALMARGFAETRRLDTVSYFDNSESNWNESPFFRKVEEQRGRKGLHVALDFHDQWRPWFDHHHFAATPGSGVRINDNSRYHQCLRSGQYRVLLQGVGGDEVLGGVPAAAPGLADLLRGGNIRLFLNQLTAWALARRTPAVYLMAETIHQFLPAVPRFSAGTIPWLRADFARRNADVLRGYDRRFTVFGPVPSFQANLAALDSLRRQIAARGLSPGEKIERRYVYLDRDLLEFLYAIPREQLLRPGQRRSLMRRALVGIVPDEILMRRRKAFIARAPLVTIQQEWAHLEVLTEEMVCERAGILNAAAFRQALRKASQGGDIPIVPALRTVLIEAWLRHLLRWEPNANLREIRVGDRVVRAPTQTAQFRHSFS